jgi:hypothetical protein
MTQILLSGIGRSFDLLMYVLYVDDQIFVREIVTNVTQEVIEEFEVQELKEVLKHKDNFLVYKCLFFLMLDFKPDFRNWVLSQGQNIGLKPICQQKALRFLTVLRDDIIPNFLINESMLIDDFERQIKVEYIRS